MDAETAPGANLHDALSSSIRGGAAGTATPELQRPRKHANTHINNFNRMLRPLGYAVMREDNGSFTMLRYEPVRKHMTNKDVQRFINERNDIRRQERREEM